MEQHKLALCKERYYELDIWERVGLDKFVRIHGRDRVLDRLDKCLSGELEDTREMRRFRERRVT